MKIALVSVAPPYRGGISTHTAVLYNYLSQNHTVELFNFNRQYPDFLFPGKTQYFESDEFSHLKSQRLIDSISPGSWRNTARGILKFEPQLVIFRFWNPFFGLSMGGISQAIKKINPKIKQIALCDNILPHESSFIDKWLTQRLFKQMDGFLVQSKKVERELLDFQPDVKCKMRYHPIYNIYGETKDKHEARESLGITAKYLVLYFGYVRQYKGLDVLIRATRVLKKKLDDFKVLALGESYENPLKYHNLIKTCEVNDVFTWQNEFVTDNEIANCWPVLKICNNLLIFLINISHYLTKLLLFQFLKI